MAKKSWKKKLLLSLAVLFVIAIALLYIFKNNLANALKDALTAEVSKMTQTTVNVKDFSVGLFQGRIKIDELNIGNPKGYNTEQSLGFKDLVIDIDLSSLKEDTIIIEEITVNGLAVTFETGFKDNNLNDIKKNVDAYAKKDKKQEEEKPEKPAEPADKEKKSKKLVIKKLNINNGQITLATKYIEGSNIPLKLANIQLTDVGSDSPKGADPSLITEAILDSIYKNVLIAVRNSDQLSEEGRKFLDKVEGGTNSVIRSIKGLFK